MGFHLYNPERGGSRGKKSGCWLSKKAMNKSSRRLSVGPDLAEQLGWGFNTYVVRLFGDGPDAHKLRLYTAAKSDHGAVKLYSAGANQSGPISLGLPDALLPQPNPYVESFSVERGVLEIVVSRKIIKPAEAPALHQQYAAE